jgi:hypothetical protein
MGYQPKHQKQLNGSATAGEDCWVRSVSMAIDFATKGAQVPSVDAIRNRANNPSGGGNTADQERAAESYDTPGETGQRQPVKYDRKVGAPWGDFTGPLQNGDKAVVLSIDYGIVNDKKPGLSGDPGFDGNHSVMFLGSREGGDGIELKAYDSLYDGRRSGIPNGPQWWPQWLAKDAAAAFAGSGKATGGVVPTSYLLDGDPEPEPPPTSSSPDPAAMESALIEERAALVTFTADAERRIAYIDTIIPPNLSAATAVVSSGVTAEEPSE